MAKYGIPYQGSKGQIAENLIKKLPEGKRFVDLFGGGFAMSHAALLSGKYEQVFYNDFEPLLIDVIKRAINGDFNYNKFVPEFVDRETFNKSKDKDGYIKYIWSFGNAGTAYLFGRDVEPTKKLAHNWVVFGKYDERLRIPKHLRKIMNGKDIKTRRLQLKKIKQLAWNQLWDDSLKEGWKKYNKIMNDNKLSPKIVVRFTKWLKATGITAKEINELTNSQMSSHYLCTKEDGQPAILTEDMWEKIKQSPKISNVPKDIEELVYDGLKLQQLERLQQLQQLERLERLEQLQQLQQLERLEQLQQLQQLQQLERLQRLELNCSSYLDYEYKPGDVVYCDPPYEDTVGYGDCDFNHKQFYDWVASRDYPVYFSSYKITDKRFKIIYCKLKTGLMSVAEGRAKKTECLYWNGV